MLHTTKFWTACLLAGLAIASSTKCISAQGALQPLAGQTSVGEALRNLSSRAGLAFAGQVQSIEHKGGVVEITFSVDQPLLGDVSSAYILREWGGLWPPGQHRYAVGQRVLIFLHPASASGLSTPVDGMNGIVPIVSQDATGPLLLDVRRIAANLQRTHGQPLLNESTGGVSLAEAAQIVSHWREPLRREPILRPLPQPLPQPVDPISIPQPLPSPTPIAMPLESVGTPDARP